MYQTTLFDPSLHVPISNDNEADPVVVAFDAQLAAELQDAERQHRVRLNAMEHARTVRAVYLYD